jgi:adenine-specific DNA-methyltransferase
VTKTAAPSLDPAVRALDDLTRDELIALLELRGEGGIHIDFSGKANARQLARRVRPRVSRTVKKYSMGSEPEQAVNALIEGDNLQAMATLYRERGQVDLILTDPPYNTGNDWRYNDRWEEDPNDPGWGEWVSADDGARHTKWMRFMWPRLQMMKSMLKPGGVLAICIDHRELFRLGQMLDELFDERNRLAIINWQKATALKNDNRHVSSSTEYVLVYAKEEKQATTSPLGRTPSQNSRYSNPDSDPRGDWREGPLHARTWAAKDDYAIQSPFTGEFHYPPGKSAWRHPKRDLRRWLEEWGTEYEERDLDDGHAPALVLRAGHSDGVAEAAARVLADSTWPFIWFGRDGRGTARRKIYLAEVKAGKIPETFWANDDLTDEEFAPDDLGSTSWAYQESGRSSDGAAELTAIVGEDHEFETVKPIKLFTKLLAIWCPPEGLVLDPFAGSGTTGHAVLAANAADETARRFILVEQGRPEKGDSYARSLTSDRLRRVIEGDWVSGERTPLGGGFRFVTLDKKVDADALLSMERDDLADTIIASHFDATARRRDTLVKIPPTAGYKYLVAKNAQSEGFFLIWNGANGNTDFTEATYAECAQEAKDAGFEPRYHVYARLYRYQTSNVVFYQIPDRILMDFGLDLRGEPYYDDES